MVRTAASYDDGPIAFRYPRGEGVGVDMPERGRFSKSARAASSRGHARSHCCRFGTRLQECLIAAEELGAARAFDHGRRCPFRQAARRGADPRLARSHEVLVTVEEGSSAASAAMCCSSSPAKACSKAA
jgi:1-deoxy-D-xylulose-5-phosphate synthase